MSVEYLGNYELPGVDWLPPFELKWKGGSMDLEVEELTIKFGLRRVYLKKDEIIVEAFDKKFVIKGGSITTYDQSEPEDIDDIEF